MLSALDPFKNFQRDSVSKRQRATGVAAAEKIAPLDSLTLAAMCRKMYTDGRFEEPVEHRVPDDIIESFPKLFGNKEDIDTFMSTQMAHIDMQVDKAVQADPQLLKSTLEILGRLDKDFDMDGMEPHEPDGAVFNYDKFKAAYAWCNWDTGGPSNKFFLPHQPVGTVPASRCG
ncbi:hypothetical protein GGTG_10139 [Gaeumannomyces tritici R3-111a-1]|uniref:Uncharacterized protein n=1 Tax=Gaeumannomyces tritici (strain R3-111a-1) TaxID=644352 RepID=J3P9F8_GAET3|nr:hypothetical protein GGTG_10139 [Gaeumannomyces tritici R3-111a-1]EJT73294.1 hypothetical protein GGTG_10139 [Gaeumannomyces tritici R3-111a-1]